MLTLGPDDLALVDLQVNLDDALMAASTRTMTDDHRVVVWRSSWLEQSPHQEAEA